MWHFQAILNFACFGFSNVNICCFFIFMMANSMFCCWLKSYFEYIILGSGKCGFHYFLTFHTQILLKKIWEYSIIKIINSFRTITHTISLYYHKYNGHCLLASFFLFLFWVFLLLSVVSLCLPCPLAPSTTVSTLGHLLGSAVWAWGWLALWRQVAAGQRTEHVVSKRSERKSQRVGDRKQMWWKAALTNH